MADEGGGTGFDSINTGGEIRENTNKVTEEAVRRVQDDQKKAQQVGQDIKKDKAVNDKFAKFLTFLLKDIKNDHLIKQIYQVFFKTRHEKTDLVHLRKSMNTIVVIGMFTPFYQDEIKELGLEGHYQDIFSFNGNVDLTKYINYIKHLLPKYHDNIIIDKKDFTKLIILITEYYHLTEKLSSEKAGEFENTIKNELSLNE
ncbi:MAG: hypothetical protein WC010_00485 [Candidatus Absconditabacterales bacterium]